MDTDEVNEPVSSAVAPKNEEGAKMECEDDLGPGTETGNATAGTGDKKRSGGGGGKRSYNRYSGRGMRRHTPYHRSSQHKAVFHQSNADSDPNCRVYVGNLSWEVTWRELKNHMKTAGCEVTRADVLASQDGSSKGCGIVEFQSEEDAKQAVATLNNTELMGRQIFLREDREDASSGGYYTQQPSSGGGGGSYNASAGNGGGGGNHRSQSGDPDAKNRRVYVGNLSWEVAWQDLKDHMRSAGEVLFSEVMRESDGRSKGCGIVEYATAEEALEATKTLTDTELKGRMIFVREDREIGGDKGGGYRRGGNITGSSVFVGNLSYETSWQDLKDHMRQAGNVDNANILTEKDGSSKGCGIVLYQNPRDASRAIRELQDTELDGRQIFVREDREHGGSGGRFNRGGGGGSFNNAADNAGNPGCQLFVGNLSFTTSWKELKDHFHQCGDVERADVMEAPDGRKKGFGFVRFSNEEDANNAIKELNGVELQGRALEVRLDHKAN